MIRPFEGLPLRQRGNQTDQKHVEARKRSKADKAAKELAKGEDQGKIEETPHQKENKAEKYPQKMEVDKVHEQERVLVHNFMHSSSVMSQELMDMVPQELSQQKLDTVTICYGSSWKHPKITVQLSYLQDP